MPKQKAEEKEKTEAEQRLEKAVQALKFRAIGPAVMGGRIIDIAVHPQDKSTWYVAAGSGGVWKTTNAGTSWNPVFEKQPSYSIGCVTVDPANPSIVWVGTGENVSGRHVGWGDGVYRSLNGGQTWEQMGLEKSEHIGRILVHPADSQTVLVAAEGPLWSAGGQRGVFKTTDGGQNWTQTLEIDGDTGVTDIRFDPANPDTVYAAAYQRRRAVWGFMGGGPSSGIYKSTDGGESWRKLTEGLPKGDMGKIGLAVTPADPNLVYATVEAGMGPDGKPEKGFYRSANKGESWEKRNDYISGGTGPHYYQVIEASPTNPDLVYQMDVFVHVTRDGGKTFKNMETGKEKHSDNHALWIDPDNGRHLLVGVDGGLYETFDEGGTWRHFPNLPLSQFYRVALDNAEPYFNIMGGAQDLGTLYGPSRTLHLDGVRNQDWSVPLGADGYHVAFDPTDPDLFYLEFQNGNLFRYNQRTRELLGIQPQGTPADPPERWNWDVPIVISPHNHKRIYYASQRVWRSDDQGRSWTAISGDLTRNLNRYELKLMGRVWSVDDLYDHGAMSGYATITNFSESPVVEGVLYAGTDDGLIQVSEDSGQTWREAAGLPDVPANSFIQAVEAGVENGDVVFAVADAHKFGDFSPYIFESRDRGRSWHSIRGDLPEGTIGWAIQQDGENPDVLFLAAEFAIHVSLDRGQTWTKMGGLPTIAFRDLKIHRRDGDLVGASFGRGFFVLDDFAPLRQMGSGALEEKAALFPVRDAWWYAPSFPMQSPGQPTLGSTAFRAENPPFGALITYHLKEDLLPPKARRHKTEKEQREADEDVPFPGWETLQAEAAAADPAVYLVIRNDQGEPVRVLKGPAKAGLHRLNWDLRGAAANPIKIKKPDFEPPWFMQPRGPLQPPGHYTVELHLVDPEKEEVNAIGDAQSFVVKPVAGDQTDAEIGEATAFQREATALFRRYHGAVAEIERAIDRINHIKAGLQEATAVDLGLFNRAQSLTKTLHHLRRQLSGDENMSRLNEPAPISIQERLWRLAFGHGNTRQRPTETQRTSFAHAQQDFADLLVNLQPLLEQALPQLEADYAAAGGPWTPGRRLD